MYVSECMRVSEQSTHMHLQSFNSPTEWGQANNRHSCFDRANADASGEEKTHPLYSCTMATCSSETLRVTSNARHEGRTHLHVELVHELDAVQTDIVPVTARRKQPHLPYEPARQLRRVVPEEEE